VLHIIWSIIVGFFVGLIACWFVPSAGHFGFLMTALIGIGGSIVGGLIARLFSRPADGAFFHPAGFFMSILGAIVLLVAAVHFGGTPA
jgi:uncharacterized membrane protein YeaQ/YmgE (transglycosylase-associated protein family)